MKTVKKFLILLSALLILLCFAGCNNTDNNGDNDIATIPSTIADDVDNTDDNDMLTTTTHNTGDEATNGNGAE